jgi:hypothetical protein
MTRNMTAKRRSPVSKLAIRRAQPDPCSGWWLVAQWRLQRTCTLAVLSSCLRHLPSRLSSCLRHLLLRSHRPLAHRLSSLRRIVPPQPPWQIGSRTAAWSPNCTHTSHYPACTLTSYLSPHTVMDRCTGGLETCGRARGNPPDPCEHQTPPAVFMPPGDISPPALPDSGAHQIQIRPSRQICFRRDRGLGFVGLGCGPL